MTQNTSDGSLIGTFPVAGSPSGIAFDGASLWVALASTGQVTELRASDGSTLGTFSVGVNPIGVAFDGTSIWVVNNSSNTVSKL